MFICLIIASVLFLVFAFLLLTAGPNLGNLLISSMCETEREKIKSANIRLKQIVEKVKVLTGEASDIKRAPDPELLKDCQKRAKKQKKIIAEAESHISAYKKSGISVIDLPPLAGYRVMQIFKLDNDIDFIKQLSVKCEQFLDRKEAVNYTYYLVASLIGHIALGICLLFLGIGFGLGMGMGTRSLVVGLIACAAVVILGYLPYDAVNVIVRKRAEDIEYEFPRVVSKLTLLSVAGLSDSTVWNLVASSEDGTLYEEMQRVIIALQNNEGSESAYTNFVKRCNNNYTAKLGTAFMQGAIRGNSALVGLLRELNNESWSEYKHSARRKAETISSKLLVPTLLLFAGIIIMVIVPAISGFNF